MADEPTDPSTRHDLSGAALRRLLMPSSSRARWAEPPAELSGIGPPEPGSAAAILANVTPALMALARFISRGARQGDYAAIIGDDTSARLPTLVLREAINRDLVGRGLPPLPVIFWRSDLEPNDGMERALINRMPGLEAIGAVNHTVLIVTDFIQSGRHMRRMIEMLRARGIEAEVAAVADAGRIDPPLDVRVHRSGLRDIRVGGLYMNSALTGLTRGSDAADPVLHAPEVHRAVAEARRAVSVVAAQVARSLN